MDILIAALLHDVVEDTSTSYEDVAANFGERVAEIVRENSDDMSLPKADRRLARIAAMPLKSREARLVKIADVISNLRAIAVSPPAGWPAERKLGYLQSCRRLVDAGRGTDAAIERIFDQTADDVERDHPRRSPVRHRGARGGGAPTRKRHRPGRASRLFAQHGRLRSRSNRCRSAVRAHRGECSRQPQCSLPRRFTRVRDGQFSWHVSEPTAQMPSLTSLSASVSSSISDLSVWKSEDDTSEIYGDDTE